MKDLNNFIVVHVDCLLTRGTMLELIDISVAQGIGVEVLDKENCVSELDVIIGKYDIETWDTPQIALKGGEPLIFKIGEMLLERALATPEETSNIRNIIQLLIGSSGYERTHSVVEILHDYELNILIAWVRAAVALQANIPADLNVGLEANINEYRKSKDMQVLVRDVVDAYQLEHLKGKRLNDAITIVPAWWWIQSIKYGRDKKYNHILKKKV